MNPESIIQATSMQATSCAYDGPEADMHQHALPELLAPAGNRDALIAAVQAGADAVYLGTGDFNARRGAENFGEGLRDAVRYCQVRSVKAYVTLNTMVRQDELPRLEATIEEICASGANGVIVQDIGVARAVRQMAPSLPLHASTQMAAHSAHAVAFLAEQGFRRVVLAREMSFAEIARCMGLGAELEVFVHGALCVSCSGQCLLSSMIGGRSGNRGLCAQPCRQRYTMDAYEGYLLSTRDLCSLEDIGTLTRLGIASLKIEGRLRRAEYVAQTVSTYRAALDAQASRISRAEHHMSSTSRHPGNEIKDAVNHSDSASYKPAHFDVSAAKRELAQMFNRGGFTRGYGPRLVDAELMYPERPNHLGVEIGRCVMNGMVSLSEATEARDILALRRSDGHGGFTDVPVRLPSSTVGNVALTEARRGDVLVRLTSDAQLRKLQEEYLGEKRKFPVDAGITLQVGESARLSLSDGVHCVLVSGDVVQTAVNRAADPERIRTQAAKLGDTPFELRGWTAHIDRDAFLPVASLNALRRSAVEALSDARCNQPYPCSPMMLPGKAEVADPDLSAEHYATTTSVSRTELIAQSGKPEILMRALDAGADFAAFAPEDLRERALNDALTQLPERFDLVLPPVMGTTTLGTVNRWAWVNVARLRRVLITNIGQLGMKWPVELVGDYFLNIANDLSVDQLTEWGFQRYVPSLELNRAQILQLRCERELVVYGRIPLMQLRHCPLRATNCMKGLHSECRHCDAAEPAECLNAKALTDHKGACFPLRRITSDEGCVVQLLNSATLMLLRRHTSLPTARAWRLLLDEDDPVEATVNLHRLALEGSDMRSDAAWHILDGMNTTTGHYFRGVE